MDLAAASQSSSCPPFQTTVPLLTRIQRKITNLTAHSGKRFLLVTKIRKVLWPTLEVDDLVKAETESQSLSPELYPSQSDDKSDSLNQLSHRVGLEESMIHLFLVRFEPVCWHLKWSSQYFKAGKFSVVPKTPQVLSKPAHPPKLASWKSSGERWVGPRKVFLPGVSDTTHWQVTLEEHCSKALGQRHKLHRRSFLVHLTSIISQSSAHTWVLIGTQLILYYLTTSDQKNQFSLTVKNDTMYLLKQDQNATHYFCRQTIQVTCFSSLSLWASSPSWKREWYVSQGHGHPPSRTSFMNSILKVQQLPGNPNLPRARLRPTSLCTMRALWTHIAGWLDKNKGPPGMRRSGCTRSLQ